MQHTDEATIQQEKELVRQLAGLGQTAPIVFNDFGWTSRVYMVGSGQIVFKFPRTPAVKKEYALELSAYKIAQQVATEFSPRTQTPHQQTTSQIQIPSIRWQHPDLDYLGYIGIVGQPGEKVIPSLSTKEKQNIGTQLGRFLKEFQQHIADAPLFSPDVELAEFSRRMDDALPHLQRFLTADELAQITHLMQKEYPKRMQDLGFTKGLCHADLGYWNIIYAPGSHSSTHPHAPGTLGIIDFGNVGYYDTSIDFAGMSDPEMLEAALTTYGGGVSRQKIALRMKSLPLFDLHFFAGKNDEAGITDTIQRIRSTTLA